jgi:hypothetical protein
VDDIDGLDLWPRNRNNGNSARSEIVYNINEVLGNAAIRQGKFKLVRGEPGRTSLCKHNDICLVD